MIGRLRRFATNMARAWKEGGFRAMWSLAYSRYVVGLGELWARWWMQHASLSRFGRLATRLAVAAPLPYLEYYEKQALANVCQFGYLSPSAIIQHDTLTLGPHIFINDRVQFQRDVDGGPIHLDKRTWIGAECIIRTGQAGTIHVGAQTSIGVRSELTAYVAGIHIGAHVMIGSYCRLFSYNHGTDPHTLMQVQPLRAKGNIVVEDNVWLGTGVIVLSGVRIGKGAVIGAGSVVTKDVPPGAVAVGNPARVVKQRDVPVPDISGERDILVDIEHDALLVRGFDGTIRFWNKGAEYLYGWEPQDTLGKRSHNLFQTIFPEPLQQIEEQLAAKGYWEGELVHIRRDGSRMVVKSRWELQYDEADRIDTVIEINTVPS